MLKLAVDKIIEDRAAMRLLRVVSLIALALLFVTAARAADTEQPRLKYRAKGPVCSCTTGLNEETIRKAWEARFPTKFDDARSTKADATEADAHHEIRDQQKKERDR